MAIPDGSALKVASRRSGWRMLVAGLFLALGRSQDVPLEQDPAVTFGTTVVRPFGLRGDIYLLREGSSSLPDFLKLKPAGSIYTSSLNIPASSFKEGFPGVTGRYEWFAIDYAGRFWIERPGEYIFGLNSDDGSRLYIDGALRIDNDGLHPPKEMTTTVDLSGGIHAIRISYFQGPCRSDPCLALQLSVRTPGSSRKIFSTDEFKPPPNPEDWKFGDASQVQHLPLSCNVQPVNSIQTVYPKDAKRKHIQGIVTLRAVIGRTGELRDLKVIDGDPLLAPAALSAAKQMRYTPCVVNSEAVDAITSIQISFKLNQ